MHPQSKKMVLIELVSLALAIILGAIAFVKGITILILMALFLIICSTLCSALFQFYTFRHEDAYKQFARALVLFFLMLWIAFRL